MKRGYTQTKGDATGKSVTAPLAKIGFGDRKRSFVATFLHLATLHFLKVRIIFQRRNILSKNCPHAP